MSMLKFKRFTKPQVLKHIGRELVSQFINRFSDELEAKDIALPKMNLADDEFYAGLANLFSAPEGLPESMSEALYAIDEMANDQGQEKLLNAAKLAGLPLPLNESTTHADLAMQVWMADPQLLADQHNRLRLVRLSSFEYYRGECPVTITGAFTPPDTARLEALAQSLDVWFSQHNRGNQTVKVAMHCLDKAWWFMIRHGDTLTRTAKVDRQKTEVLHFRPAKDDVVVYSPELDEIRVHATTKGEKELYRKQFGQCLHGDLNHFSALQAYTLEPLRTDGIGSLSTDGIEGIRKIVLSELEVVWGGDYEEVMVRKAPDLFDAAKARNRNPIPLGGRLVRAVFEFTFQDATKSRRVQIRPPNVLKFGRHCDARLVDRWLSAREFRAAAGKEVQCAKGEVLSANPSEISKQFHGARVDGLRTEGLL
jgi:hypothetical protein